MPNTLAYHIHSIWATSSRIPNNATCLC